MEMTSLPGFRFATLTLTHSYSSKRAFDDVGVVASQTFCRSITNRTQNQIICDRLTYETYKNLRNDRKGKSILFILTRMMCSCRVTAQFFERMNHLNSHQYRQVPTLLLWSRPQNLPYNVKSPMRSSIAYLWSCSATE